MTATPSDNAAVISGSKHTPGPWQMDITPDEWVEVFPADNQNVVAICARQLGFNTDVDAQSIANARLIAASPDLLDAAKEGRTDLMLIADNVRDAAKTDPRWDGVAEKLMARVKMMDAAIAKAEAGQ